MTSATATDTAHLPPIYGEFETLPEALTYAARGDTGCNFFSPRGQLTAAMTYREIDERARDIACGLVASGLEKGTRVALLAETCPDFPVFFFACQYAGVVPVPLPLNIHMGAKRAYVTRLRGMLSGSGAALALGPRDLMGSLGDAAEGLHLDLASFEAFRAQAPQGGDLRPFAKDDPCYIQYSSGSTTAPRGVLITQKALTTNTRGMLVEGMGARRGDRSASWLPLYHDMGLVGFFLGPMMGQISVDYLSTAGFARRPLVWLKLISEYGATISFSPTFGYDLCLRRGLTGEAESLDLSHWRVAGIGGEMVRADVLEGFAEVFGKVGFSANAFLPSYGLAEATLAVTFPSRDRGAILDSIDREHLADTGEARPLAAGTNGSADRVRRLVFCGRALRDHKVEIRDAAGEVQPERRVGRVMVKGASVMGGYFGDPERSAQVLDAEGWLDTGDLGYQVDGELVITGRGKDLIIHNGRNIWPQDIEWAIESLDGPRVGDVACFSVEGPDGGESIVVVVQSRVTDPEAIEALRKSIAATVQQANGVICRVVVVRPRSLTYTSSGKLSRAAVKVDFEAGLLKDMLEDPPETTVQPDNMAPAPTI